jgi:hypothetical protein
MDKRGRFLRLGAITIDSDRIFTVEMVILLVIVGAMLIWKIRVLAFGVVIDHVSLLSIIIVVYCFIFAFSIPGKFVKTALCLLGTETACRLILRYAHASPSVRHAASVGGSIVDQIALTIILIVILQWFKSVVHWTPSIPEGREP